MYIEHINLPFREYESIMSGMATSTKEKNIFLRTFVEFIIRQNNISCRLLKQDLLYVKGWFI